MGQYYNPQVVLDNLIYNLDFANTRSYPGSGITFNSISPIPSVGGTTINNPTFLSSNSGCMSFNGTDQYAFSNFSSSFSDARTIEIWVYLNSTTGTPQIFSSDKMQIYFQTANVFVTADTLSGAVFLESTTTINTGQWYQFVFTKTSTIDAQIYINGVADVSSGGFDTISGGDGNFYFMVSGVGGQGADHVNGKLSIFRYYSRAFSAKEVLKNYLANKGRFGL